MIRGLVPILLLGLAVAITVRPSYAEDSADLILQHGVFYPVQPAGRVEGSLAIRGGRIVYLGPDAGATAFKGPKTRVIDLAGRVVTPGLIDAHSHLAGLGQALAAVDLTAAPTFDEVVRRVKEAAAKVPKGTWVGGRGWDQNLWPEKDFPTHGALSAAVPDHPVWLTRVDGHAALVNAKAMEIVGLGPDIQDPPGGRFLRDGDGRPTGVMIDNAMDVVGSKLPAATVQDKERELRSASRHCLELGLTTVTDMGVGPAEIAAYTNLLKAGELPIRSALFLGDNEQLLASWFQSGPQVDPTSRLLIRGVKLYADGALGSRGAALLEPYSDDANNLGLMVAAGSHLEDVSRRAAQAGFQVGIHAIGDRGSLVAIDAMEKAIAGKPDARFRLEHTQVTRVQDLQRMAKLGIVASMQPTHATSDMPWADERIGEGRLERAYAWRKVLDFGGRLALGSDFPVESADPRLGLYAAVTRQDLSGQPEGGWLPGERLTREEALRGFTLDAAWSLFLDKEVGSLEVGKRADLVVFSRDIMTVPEKEIPKVEIDYTLVDGKVSYQREERSKRR
ncbi:MAG TPA: amidohydrolase [Thermoanaerobaculia bacterium]|nr:amidohydrolase [Thermoanaerobaculia bacterium]